MSFDEDLTKIINVITDLKLKRKGQHKDNIVKYCEKFYKWSGDITEKLLEMYVKEDYLLAQNNNKVTSYRVNEDVNTVQVEEVQEESDVSVSKINTSPDVADVGLGAIYDEIRTFRAYVCEQTNFMKEIYEVREKIKLTEDSHTLSTGNTSDRMNDGDLRHVLDGKDVVIDILRQEIKYLRK